MPAIVRTALSGLGISISTCGAKTLLNYIAQSPTDNAISLERYAVCVKIYCAILHNQKIIAMSLFVLIK
ncbi:hypothetical protein SF1_14480 [Sphingobacterium faecium NBRC 15299]|nr:hypothetical protein SF1_14480 [Sphingobacterium faecium NBRC 15299]